MAEAGVYVTVKKDGKDELVEKKSTFIGMARRVTTSEEATEFIKSVKKRYPDARHHVYAYLLKGGVTARYSDDGEPQGTGGMPVLEIIKKSGAEDVCIVVTRYFGGILLGTGGLTRAYSAAAKLALDSAEVVKYVEYTELRLACSYGEYQKYLAILPTFHAIVDDTVYDDRVTVCFALKNELVESFSQKVVEMSGGQNAPEVVGKRYDLLFF